MEATITSFMFRHCESSRPFASVFLRYADKLVAQLNGCASSTFEACRHARRGLCVDDGLTSVPCTRLCRVPSGDTGGPSVVFEAVDVPFPGRLHFFIK